MTERTGPCKLQLFIYGGSELMQAMLRYATDSFTTRGAVLKAGYHGTCPFDGSALSTRACQLVDFGNAHTGEGAHISYTADIPILRRFMDCPTTTEPGAAEAFLVPFAFGMATTLRWGARLAGHTQREVIKAFQRNASALLKALPYLIIVAALCIDNADSSDLSGKL